ncbi:hypothetical protein N0V83_005584 [Neocucurbitaria cava]|uniref:BHLH domain-containing protein n=1 Tax=Neocucurbitaria cava TaxID=798079 RepID=A0A9W9CM62_9PLEO|nr:hypothetical protein N0V83_005584 [Neocucurbitaria cava]
MDGPYPQQQQQQPPDNDRNEGGHRGPLSRTWPQLFKKRRRYSPVRESALQQQQQQQQQAQLPQAQPPPHAQQHVQPPLHPIHPIQSPSITSQSMKSPGSSMRSPSIAADTASTISTLSHASSVPPNKIPIARRSSSIVPTDTNGKLFHFSQSIPSRFSVINCSVIKSRDISSHPSRTTYLQPPTGAGGVATPQADLLASKSNYELISSGQHLEMGLHFSTAMATGVMMKRATHRAAEQARRDRMKNAMVDLAEFLLDGEVTFGSGTTCFVVMRGKEEGDDGGGDAVEKGGDGRKGSGGSGVAGEKKTVNKARLIEMALEKMKAQEKEIEMLRKEVEDMRTVGDPSDRMDET